MLYKPGDKCYLMTKSGPTEHTVEAINFHPLCQMIKVEGKWQCADIFFKCKEDILDAILSDRVDDCGRGYR